MASLYFGTTNEKISGLFVFTLGAAPGATYLAQANSAGLNATAQALINATGASTTSALADIILAKLGVPSTDTAAKAEVLAFLGGANAQVANAGAGLVSLLNAVTAIANPSSPLYATYGSYASTFVSNLETAAAYSSVSTNTSTDLSTLQTVVSTASSPVGSTFTLTTNVDAVSGSAYNDTISGLIGTSGTYTVGDNIIGGSGTDTLNLIASSGSAAGGVGGLIQVQGVENINVRLLNTATTDVSMNAADWSGVAILSDASSQANTTLTVSGLASDVNVTLHGNTDISVGYATTTTSNAVATLVSAGTFAGATDIFASATANATANLDLDLADGGLVSGIAVTISGSANYARLEAGSNADAYTITGSGNATLVTDDTITTFNASGAFGNIDASFSGASDLVVTGGAGDDTFRFGTTFTNNDSVNGGSGTDTVYATIAGFNRNLNTTAVESAVLTFSEAAGGDVNASASTVTGITFAAGTAGNAASVSQIGSGATVTLSDDDLGNVTLDYASGVSSTVLDLGSASGTVTIGTLAITDVVNVTINAVGVSGTVGGTITTATFDSDLKLLTIQTSGGEADLTIGDTNTDMSLGGATSLNVTTNGSAGITFNAVDLAGTALSTITVNAKNDDAADITIGDISGQALTTINLTAVSGADVIVGTLDLGSDSSGTTQDEIITIVQGQTSDVTVGNITVSGQGTLTLNLTQNGTGTTDVATITLDKSTNATADAAGQNLTFGALTVAGSGVVAINNIDAEPAGTGAQITFGAVTVGQDGGYSAGHISGTATINVDISAVTLSVGASATATFGNIVGLSGGVVGAVSVTLAENATATFGTVTASAISTHTIVANTGASANFGAMTAEQTVGAIEISGVDGADVQFGAIGASAVGAISVSGALDVTFGTITTTTIGEVNATGLGVSGSFTIDLSGVTNAAEVKLGAASNVVISGGGNDVITLLGGRTSTAGNDTIRFSATGQGTDNVINFIAGAAASGGDVISIGTAIGTATLMNGDGEAVANADAADLSVALFNTATAVATTDNVFVIGTALATTAAMLDFFDGVSLATAAQGSSEFIVAWTDGTDTYITIVDAIGAGSAAATTLASGAHTLSAATLVTISGVSAGALVAANFDFV